MKADSVPSPMFTEDQGPISMSFPNSPDLSMRYSSQNNPVFHSTDYDFNNIISNSNMKYSNKLYESNDSFQHSNYLIPPPPPATTDHNNHTDTINSHKPHNKTVEPAQMNDSSNHVDELIEENDRLKKVVREMRKDIEGYTTYSLQTQILIYYYYIFHISIYII